MARGPGADLAPRERVRTLKPGRDSIPALSAGLTPHPGIGPAASRSSRLLETASRSLVLGAWY